MTNHANPPDELAHVGQVRHWTLLSADEMHWSAHGIFHVLVVLSGGVGDAVRGPAAETYAALAQRQHAKGAQASSLGFEPLIGMTPQGVLISWLWLAGADSTFARVTRTRQALQALLDEKPTSLAVWCADAGVLDSAVDLLWTVTLNTDNLPNYRKDKRPTPCFLYWQGHQPTPRDMRVACELAAANSLTRALTLLPPNRLEPAHYRAWIERMAAQEGWSCTTFDVAQLERLGAGAFLAVARGSANADAAIVCLRHRSPRAERTVALVGKGICFDTGGVNLKPAKFMWDMHGDMNGSAVALALLQVLSRLDVPLNVDVWLALAQNAVGPASYRQNEVLTTLAGVTLEVVHTDAEGRLVLADALTLAAREAPDLIVDFATLTGSMQTALGTRYSGAFVRPEGMRQLVEGAGLSSGERMWVFPQDEDYDAALESKVADVKQCTLDSDADHILAVRMLGRFCAGIPWVHVDLSASMHEGGLGAVASEVTGFGVRWGLEFLDKWRIDPV